ncbi:MAG TPA: ABC transporter ATP-binding protein [Acetobacteraceae bacterium]|nr:ABC transporter ATP-binding protein [Acetobacteraceae bacterium]
MPGASATSPQLVAQGITKRFGGVAALQDVSISVREGEMAAIIGPNGAGKTSLLNVISGFYQPDRGTIRLDGADITRLAPARVAALGIARTFQNIALFSGLTVLENVMLGRHVHMRAGVLGSILYWGLAQKEEVAHRARVEELLEFLDIQDISKRPTATLPYGMRKRVELARALALEPRILLLDEPMGGMNEHEREDMARLVMDINRNWRTTIILIEHDIGVVMDLSDRVFVLDQGRTIAAGTPVEVQQNPEVVRAYLGVKHGTWHRSV